jgi:dihydrofolate reductase
MAKLTYAAIASLDGYVEDEEGKCDWAMPDEEVHAFVNDLERPIASYLYGRRMYETMVFWGDREHPGRRAAGVVRLRRDLKDGRERRVLPDASDDIQREDVMNPC